VYSHFGEQNRIYALLTVSGKTEKCGDMMPIHRRGRPFAAMEMLSPYYLASFPPIR
jgi:hypothetical protein